MKRRVILLIILIICLIVSPLFAGYPTWIQKMTGALGNKTGPWNTVSRSVKSISEGTNLTGRGLLADPKYCKAKSGLCPDLNPYPQGKTSEASKEKQIPDFIPAFVGSELRSLSLNPDLMISKDQFFGKFQTMLGVPMNRNEGSGMVEVDSVKDQSYLNREVTWNRYEQRYKGLRVVGTSYGLKIDGGAVSEAIGKVLGGLDLKDVKPVIDQDKAIQIALAEVGPEILGIPDGTGNSAEAATPKKMDPLMDEFANDSPSMKEAGEAVAGRKEVYPAELVISTKNYTMDAKDAGIVWQIAFPGAYVEVDAMERKVWNVNSRVATLTMTPKKNVKVTGLGYRPYGSDPKDPKRVEFIANQDTEGRYWLLTYPDDLFGVKTSVYDNRNPQKQAGSPAPPPYLFKDHNDDGQFDDLEDDLGVSAIWAMQKQYFYFLNHFKNLEGKPWLGTDGKGLKEVAAVIFSPDPKKKISAREKEGHGPLGFAGYYIDDAIYLRPPGKEDDKSKNVIGTLELANHELSHAFFHAGVPNFINQRETGSLNEGYAELLSLLVKRDTLKLSEGSEAWINIRPIDNPNSWGDPSVYLGPNYEYYPADLPCTAENDWCAVHHNASILTHWFYVLSVGGEKGVIGIGLPLAEQILVGMLKYPGCLNPVATFKDARLCSLKVVEELSKNGTLPPTEKENILTQAKLAWTAVGVGEGPRAYSPYTGTIEVKPWPTDFLWSALLGEKYWQIQVAEDPSFKTPVKDDFVALADMKPGPAGDGQAPTVAKKSYNLKPGKEYYWRVRPVTSPKTTVPPAASLHGVMGKVLDTSQGVVEGANLGTMPQGKITTADPVKDWGDTQYFGTSSMDAHIIFPTLKQGTGTYEHPWSFPMEWERMEGIQSYKVSHMRLVQEMSYQEHGDYNLYTKKDLPREVVSKIYPATDPDGATIKHSVVLNKARIGVCVVFAIGPEGLQIDDGQYAKCLNNRNSISCEVIGHVSFVGCDTGTPKGEITGSVGGTVSWKPVPNAGGYELAVASDTAFQSQMKSVQLGPEKTSVSLESLGVAPGNYFVRIRPFGPSEVGNELGDWSEVASTGPSPNSPQLNAFTSVACGGNAALSWSGVSGAQGYRVHVCRKSNNECTDYNVKGGTTSLALNSAQGASDWQGYRWSVQALMTNGALGSPSAESEYDVQVPPLHLNVVGALNDAEYWPTKVIGILGKKIEGSNFYETLPCSADSYQVLFYISKFPEGQPLYGMPEEQYSLIRNVGGGNGFVYDEYNRPHARVSVWAKAMKDGLMVQSKPIELTTKSGLDPKKTEPQSTQKQPVPPPNAACNTPPTTPPQVTMTPFNGDASSVQFVPPSVLLSWPPVAGATGYRINYVSAGSVTALGGLLKAAVLSSPASADIAGNEVYLFSVIPQPPEGTGYLLNVQAKDACGQLGPTSLPMGMMMSP